MTKYSASKVTKQVVYNKKGYVINHKKSRELADAQRTIEDYLRQEKCPSEPCMINMGKLIP